MFRFIRRLWCTHKILEKRVIKTVTPNYWRAQFECPSCGKVTAQFEEHNFITGEPVIHSYENTKIVDSYGVLLGVKYTFVPMASIGTRQGIVDVPLMCLHKAPENIQSIIRRTMLDVN